MLVSDEGCNPFYCSVDAATFLRNLRLGLALHRHSQDHHLRQSFASCLLRECGDLELLAPGADVHVPTVQSLSSSYGDVPKLPLILAQADDFLTTHTDRLWIPVSSPSPPTSPLTSSSIDARRKLLDGYSDLRGASLWAKSSDGVNRGSFELSGKADKIKFSLPGLVYSPADLVLNRFAPQDTRLELDSLVARVQELEGLCSDWLWLSTYVTLVPAAELRGRRIGSETPRSLRVLAKHLDFLLPGIRLLERLSGIPDLDHQKIVNVLAEGGSYSCHRRPAAP